MKRVGVVGIGDMGSGLALNLIKAGFETTGIDLLKLRMDNFIGFGGKPAKSVLEVAQNSDAVFVMVMNGDEAKDIILGNEGLAKNMLEGSVVILSSTVKPSEAREISVAMVGSGVHIIDSPVSGGFPGAQTGTLTMMAAGNDEVLNEFAPIMEAVSSTIHRVGKEPGDGQVVKACLQSLLGSIFSATFEAAALAAKAGVSGDVLYKVVSSSSGGCGITNSALENIIDRKFEGTGSHIRTMHKDLTISLDLARDLGVPLYTASSAMQLFQAGKTKYPNGDNWIVTRVIEEIIGAELHR